MTFKLQRDHVTLLDNSSLKVTWAKLGYVQSIPMS